MVLCHGLKILFLGKNARIPLIVAQKNELLLMQTILAHKIKG